MAVYFEATSPVGWNNSLDNVNALNKNNIPVVVYPGGSIWFSVHETFFPTFTSSQKVWPDVTGDKAVHTSYDITANNLAITGASVFTDVGSTSLPLGVEYSSGGSTIDVVDVSLPQTGFNYWRADESVELLAPITVRMRVDPSAYSTTSGSLHFVGLNPNPMSVGDTAYKTDRMDFSIDEAGDVNYYYGNSSYALGTFSSGDRISYTVTSTDIELSVNGSLQASHSRTTTYSLSPAAITDGHTLVSGGSPIGINIGDTINIPLSATPGTYTVSVLLNSGQTATATYQVSDSASLTNSPLNGTCWTVGEAINFTANTGTITSVVSITPGLTGVSGGIGTSSATFTISTITAATGTIRVTTSNGDSIDFVVSLCTIITMLPPITNIIDDPNVTTDDAANTPPTSIYQCVGVTVDVRGPSFPSGDVTWSILDSLSNPVVTGATFTGQNTVQCTFSLDDTVAPGNYTLVATETATPANTSSHAFTLVALPPITVGASQPYVGGHTQFNTIFPFPVSWGPAEVNTSTGLATWTTAGVKTVSYTPVSSSCVKTLSYTVYSPLSVAEYDGTNCVYVNSGDTVALTVTGGSGSYSYAVTGQNTVSSSGVVTAGIYAGNYAVSITDTVAGIISIVPICVGNQAQFCTAVSETVCIDEQADPCCELSVNCGETISLSIPSFHMRVNGAKEEIVYSSYTLGAVGPGGYLKSGASATDAVANVVDCSDNEALFEIVTSLDMADVANAPFGIGFSKQDGTSGVSSIDIGVVWYTSAGTRYVNVRKNNTVLTGSTFAILQGDVVSSGFSAGRYVLYINNILRFETSDFDCCGKQFLDIAIEEPNKALGGNISGLTWSIVTPGSVAEVGFITPDGMYNSPVGGAFSVVEAQATAGNGTFNVRIRNIKPSIRYTRPDAFLAGKAVTLWVGPYMPNFNEPIRLAKDGSPDAIQNPMMIDCGTLEGSANFQEAFDYQDFENDLGQIYHTSLVKESATLTATFLEVRDLYKLKTLKPEGTLHAKNRGTTEFSVGGKSCDLKELRVIMVIGQPGCDDKYDVLYLPRVQNKGNLGLEIGKKTNGKYELNLTALPDYSRPAGKQLYSIFQIDDCSSKSCS